MAWRLLCALFLVVLTGCAATTRPIIQRIPFPVEEYAILPIKGTAIVKGQAFLKTRGGDVKTAAGNEVLLNPVTSYSNQWYEQHYLRGNNLDPGEADKRLRNYIQKTTADAEGRFIFKDVPKGNYYLTTTVIWEAPTGYGGSLMPQGGLVVKEISINDGEELNIILTQPY